MNTVFIVFVYLRRLTWDQRIKYNKKLAEFGAAFNFDVAFRFGGCCDSASTPTQGQRNKQGWVDAERLFL